MIPIYYFLQFRKMSQLKQTFRHVPAPLLPPTVSAHSAYLLNCLAETFFLRFSSWRSSVLSDRGGATESKLFLFFFQGLEIVFRVGLAILQMNQTELVQLDMEGMLQVSCSQQLYLTVLVQSLQSPPPLTSSRAKT